jgi:23S rRNA-intervening sequence protein
MSDSFTDLTVWQMALDLALDVYRQTSCFPREETYCAGLLFLSLATSRKERAGNHEKSSINSYFMRAVRYSNFKPR